MRILQALMLLMLCADAYAVTNEKFLDKNTIYCHSKQSLASYLKYAQVRDMQGLNLMVETGECDFVPGKKKISINVLETTSIGSTPVIAFEWRAQTLWTFQKLLMPAGQ